MLTFLIVLDIIAFLGITALEEFDQDFLATAVVVLTVIVTVWAGHIDLLSIAVNDIWYILFGAVAWFAVGTLWMIFRWHLHVTSEDMQSYVKDRYDMWKQRTTSKDSENASFDASRNIPNAMPWNNKSRIIRWIIFWPSSMFYSATFRLVRRVAVWIYDRVGKVLLDIAMAQLKKMLPTVNFSTEE